jgi:hypothetical protein
MTEFSSDPNDNPDVDLDPTDGQDSLGINELLDYVGRGVESILDFIVPDGLLEWDLNPIPDELAKDGFYREQDLESTEGVDPGMAADPTANFDPLVRDALDSSEDIEPLVDETIAGLPDQTPTSGPFAGLEGGVPGGSGTEAVTGFINARGAEISDMVGRIESGQDLTEEQIAQGEHIIRSGLNFDPLLVGDEIHNKAIDDLERITYGNIQTDSNGQTWRYSPLGDRWYKVGESGGLTPTDEIPPFQREHPSLSEFWGEVED